MAEDFDTLAAAARGALGEGALERADALFGRLVEAHPGRPLGLVGRAQAALRRRDFAAALGLWEECWARHPDARRPDWLRGRAEALGGLGRIGEAEALIAPLVAAAPDDFPMLATFASLAAADGRWRDALTRWDRLLERSGARAQPRWRLARAEALFRLGEHAAAEAAYREIAQADPRESFAATRYLQLLGRASPPLAALAEVTEGRFKDHPSYEVALLGAQFALRCDEMDPLRRILPRLTAEASRAHHVAATFDLIPAGLEGRARVEAWAALESRAQTLANGRRDADLDTSLAQLKLALRDPRGFLNLLDDPAFAPSPAWGEKFAKLARRLRAPAFPDHDAPKVFGVGLSKTGTTSLSQALERLGYLVAHYKNPFTGEIVTAEDAFLFDALSDLPICPDFEALFHLFPNSKFVYTTRPMETWLRSSERHLREQQGSTDFAVLRARMTTPGRTRYGAARARSAVALFFRYPDLRTARLAFEARIAEFFGGARADRLLRLDMSAGEGWEKLCGFLGRPLPDAAFPWENRAPT